MFGREVEEGGRRKGEEKARVKGRKTRTPHTDLGTQTHGICCGEPCPWLLVQYFTWAPSCRTLPGNHRGLDTSSFQNLTHWNMRTPVKVGNEGHVSVWLWPSCKPCLWNVHQTLFPQKTTLCQSLSLLGKCWFGFLGCNFWHPLIPGSLPGTTFICLECPSGSFQASGASVSCDLCPKGSYQNETKSLGCNRCPVGQYQSEEGQPGCKECPPGATTLLLGSNSMSDCGCVAGSINIASGEALECIPCREGLDCPFSSSIRTLQTGTAGQKQTRLFFLYL